MEHASILPCLAFSPTYISNPSMLYMLGLPLWSRCITHSRKFHLENHTLCETIWPIIIIEPFLPRCKTPKLGFISFVNQIGWEFQFLSSWDFWQWRFWEFQYLCSLGFLGMKVFFPHQDKKRKRVRISVTLIDYFFLKMHNISPCGKIENSITHCEVECCELSITKMGYELKRSMQF